jgi:hypothetical protein
VLQARCALTLVLLPVFARLVAGLGFPGLVDAFFRGLNLVAVRAFILAVYEGVGRSFEALALVTGSGLMPATTPKGYLLSTKWHHCHHRIRFP